LALHLELLELVELSAITVHHWAWCSAGANVPPAECTSHAVGMPMSLSGRDHEVL
jgi:hypothetical protein